MANKHGGADATSDTRMKWRNFLPATKSDIDKLKGLLMATLTDLETQVTANTNAEKAALALIQGLAAKIEAAKTDPAKIQALADELKSSADDLAAAVVANTPAAQ